VWGQSELLAGINYVQPLVQPVSQQATQQGSVLAIEQELELLIQAVENMEEKKNNSKYR